MWPRVPENTLLLPMRSVALAGLMAALPVRVSLAQRLAPPFTCYTYRLDDRLNGWRTRITDPGVQAHGSRHASVVGGLHGAGGALLYVETQRTWGHSRGRFHVKSDWTGDGLSQNDEVSHLFFGYTLTRTLSAHWRWSGMPPSRARTVGAVESAFVLTMVEALDAFNPTQGLGIGDLLFDYAGVGAGLWTLSHSADWGIRTSLKAPAKVGLFAETVRQSDNYVFWVTYRPPLRWGPKQPVSVGAGHSARRGPDGVTPVRELHFGIGTTLPDIVRTFSPHAARYVGVLDFYYFNLNFTATLR